jgi:type VI secretion system secreted protein Hcp
MSREKILGIAVVAALIIVGLLATASFGEPDNPRGATPSNTSGVEMYLKFDGVDGEAQDKDHRGWSDLYSFNQGMSNPTIDGRSGRRRGDVVLEDIVVVKELDKSSPKIAESVCNGKVFPKVEIHVTESYAGAGRVTYYRYELTNVMVTSYMVVAPTNTESSSGVVGPTNTRDVPVEMVSLNFEEIKVTYTEYDDKGSSKGNVEYSWKVEEGEP